MNNKILKAIKENPDAWTILEIVNKTGIDGDNIRQQINDAVYRARAKSVAKVYRRGKNKK